MRQYVGIVLLCFGLFGLGIGIGARLSERQVDDYRGRLREAEQRVDDKDRELAESNRRALELAENVRTSIDELKGAVSGGTRTLAERIRAIAKEVSFLEDRLHDYEWPGSYRSPFPDVGE